MFGRVSLRRKTQGEGNPKFQIGHMEAGMQGRVSEK